MPFFFKSILILLSSYPYPIYALRILFVGCLTRLHKWIAVDSIGRPIFQINFSQNFRLAVLITVVLVIKERVCWSVMNLFIHTTSSTMINPHWFRPSKLRTSLIGLLWPRLKTEVRKRIRHALTGIKSCGVLVRQLKSMRAMDAICYLVTGAFAKVTLS